MGYSVGIWAHAQLPGKVVYRWEADGGAAGEGFVLLDTGAGTVRPCTAEGLVRDTLELRLETGAVTGQSAGVSTSSFARTAAAILKRYLTTGEAPETAHSYFA